MPTKTDLGGIYSCKTDHTASKTVYRAED